MKSSDRTVLIAVLIAGVLAAFWFLVVSPKRAEVSRLDDEIAGLEASVSEQEQLASFAEEAQTGYKGDYHQLVVLGKAVPADDDSASLIEQTQTLADRAKIDFRTIILAEAAGTIPGAPTTAQPATPAPPAETPPASEGTPATTTTPAPATETAAAILPVGATVGPAGLPIMPYDLSFRGNFFEIADFMARLDGMVRVDTKGVGVDGRLLTVDGFAFKGDQAKGYPFLEANLHVTSYVAPADQGLTGGATAVAPAPGTTAPAAAPIAATTGEVVP